MKKLEQSRSLGPGSSLQKLRPDGSQGTADEDRRQVDHLPDPLAGPPRRTRAILRTRTCGPGDFTADAVRDPKNLERDGLVIRELFPEVPPRVEYEITDLGKSLLRPTQGLVDWAKANWEQVREARFKYDGR